jgi:hypothetical protein
VLHEVIAQNQALQEILVIRSNGTFVANASDEQLMVGPEMVVESSWFQQTQDGNLYLGDVQLSASDEPYLILATPTATGNIVATRVNMSILREVVAEVRFGTTGVIYIMDRNSNVIAHTDREVMLNGRILCRPPIWNEQDAPGGSRTRHGRDSAVGRGQARLL